MIINATEYYLFINVISYLFNSTTINLNKIVIV